MPEDLVWGWMRRCVGGRSSRGEGGRRAVVSCEAGRGGGGTVCSGTGFGGGMQSYCGDKRRAALLRRTFEVGLQPRQPHVTALPGGDAHVFSHHPATQRVNASCRRVCLVILLPPSWGIAELCVWSWQDVLCLCICTCTHLCIHGCMRKARLGVPSL